MKKTTININDEEIEIDFDTFDKEEAEKMGINVHDEEKIIKKRKYRKIKNKIIGITPFVILIAFFLTGFLIDGAWKWNWSFFLAIPVVSTLLNLRFKKLNNAISTVASLLILAAYFVSGFCLHWWSFNWVIFFVFPIVWILCGE